MAIFSRRTSWDRTPTALAECLRKKRAAGEHILDLTESNPTRCNITRAFDDVALLLNNSHARTYSPNPRGIPEARQAIARWYAKQGANVSPESVVLTSGTSEAYWFLMTLLCDSGDEILLPRPTYPLVELLAQAHEVHLKPYALRCDGEWLIDLRSLESQLSARTRGVIVVHPNNPTGSYVKAHEREWLSQHLGRGHIALISDEVFWSHPHGNTRPVQPSFVEEEGELTFVLNGLSKLMGLPQLKLSWIVVAGPSAPRDEALERLEMLADLTLSVSVPVQGALAGLLERSDEFTQPVHERITENLAIVKAACRSCPGIDVLAAEGGWSSVLRVPHIVSDEQWGLLLLEHCGVLVYPGSRFDFSGGAYLVISLLPESSVLREGIGRLVNLVSARVRA